MNNKGIFAGSLESTHSLISGAHEILGQGGGETLASRPT